jgi:hypothetical protein
MNYMTESNDFPVTATPPAECGTRPAVAQSRAQSSIKFIAERSN